MSGQVQQSERLSRFGRERLKREAERRAQTRKAWIMVACVAIGCFVALHAAFFAVGFALSEEAYADEPAASEADVSPSQGRLIDLGADNVLNPQQTPDSSFIYDTSIEELATTDSYMNDQTVQVRGEVVGDRINAELDPDHCWIVLQSLAGTDSTISVFMRTSLSRSIDMYGAYGRTGTTLQVRGTFNLACQDHEGMSDLHADHVSVIRKGSTWDNPFPVGEFVLGVLLILVGLAVTFVFWRLRESRR